MLSDVAITLNIQSNVNYPVNINILGNPSNLLDTSNATTEYRWNFTTFTFGTESQLILQYQSNGASVFSNYTSQITSTNLNGIVYALNQLGIGTFNTYTELGQTYIGTYNQNYIFGQLNIYTPSIINPSFFYGSGFNQTVLNSAVQSDGKIVCVGSFGLYNGVSTPFIARINTDGSLDTSFNIGTGFDANAGAVLVQPDGKIVVTGGFFTSYNGTPANGIIRLNSDGSVDPTFNYGTGLDSFANSIAIQSDGKILIGGAFTIYDGNSANKIVRLNPNGSIDATFVYGTGFNNDVRSVKVDSLGNILIGGAFTLYNGTPANSIIRLTSTGSVDATFVYGTAFNGSLESISIQSDGNIVCGGTFTSYNGTPANLIIRLTSVGAVDPTFIYGTGFSNAVQAIVIQNDGKIICGGSFTSYQGNSYLRIIRLNADGSIDTNWLAGGGFNTGVFNLSIFNNVLTATGNFTSFNGTPAPRIIQLII